MRPKFVNILFVLFYIIFDGGNTAVNGSRIPRDTQQNLYPFLVQLGYNSMYGNVWQCAGTLIKPTKVLTTIECSNRKLFGAPNIVRNNFGQAKIQKTLANADIAILSLTEPIPTKITACITSNLQRPDGISAGWGGLYPDNLLHGTGNKELNIAILNTFEYVGSIAKAKMEDQSICVSDAGGPFLYAINKSNCTYEIYGLLKQWKDCGECDSFGEYLTLSGYKAWIQEHI